MNRHYTTEEFRQKTELLRQAFDAPAITTDVIVGFPGETEEEFETTCSFLESIAFYEMHVFKYSKRQGTVAAGLPDQIEDRVKTIRSNRLLQMSAEQSAQYRQSMLGTRVEVLFEEEKVIDGQICQVGFTPTYVKAAVKTGEDLSNKIVQGKALSLLENEYLLLEI
jgi:threonylcarbamoyladenosine tRNA methylthiotransferase MtaB